MKHVWIVVVALSCQGTERPADTPARPDSNEFEPPVATNAESPVRYPPQLFQQTIEGTVVLRLFVDSTGRVFPDSTRVAEGSGYPALDSAALAGVARMTFAPARRSGAPVAAVFLQPVYFRHPERRSPGGL